MKFRIWHVFIVLLVLGFVTGGIAYAQSPDRRTLDGYTSAGQNGGEKFFTQGATSYAAGSATTYVISNGTASLGPVVAFTVPTGKKADIIATFSGEVTNPGPSTNDSCFGVLSLTNQARQMNPAGGLILFNQQLVTGNRMVNASIQQYLRKVTPGDYSINFKMHALNANHDAQCAAGFRTITVIANIY